MTVGIVEALQSLQGNIFEAFFNLISFLGEEYVIIVILGTVYWTIDKKLGEIMAISLGVSSVSNNIIKELVGADRPFKKYPDRVENLRPGTATGNSFPSGHTQNFSAFLSSAAIKLRSKKLKYLVFALVILMMLSRMYLGVHFLEDVLVAAVLGLLIAYGINYIHNKYSSNQVLLHRIYLSFIIVSTPFVLFLQDEDFFKSYGLLVGIVFAIIFEKKYIKFTFDPSKLKKIIRLSLGLIIVLTIQIGLKAIFSIFLEEGTMAFNYANVVRYFAISFIGFGVYPMSFKKLNI